jgi:hypothetical protein
MNSLVAATDQLVPGLPLVALLARRSLGQSIMTGWAQVHYIEQFSVLLTRP